MLLVCDLKTLNVCFPLSWWWALESTSLQVPEDCIGCSFPCWDRHKALLLETEATEGFRMPHCTFSSFFFSTSVEKEIEQWMSGESGVDSAASSCLPYKMLSCWKDLQQHDLHLSSTEVLANITKSDHNSSSQHLVISLEIMVNAMKCCYVSCKVLQAFARLPGLGPFIMIASN